MNEISTTLVSDADLIHQFSRMGFRPADVLESISTFTVALAIPVRNGHLLQMHQSEMDAFQLYLSRVREPRAPEAETIRTEALFDRVQAEMESWGDTAEEVMTRFRFDELFGADYDDIGASVEMAICAGVRLTAVTFYPDRVMVDGVLVLFPPAVREAVQLAAYRQAGAQSRAPF